MTNKNNYSVNIGKQIMKKYNSLGDIDKRLLWCFIGLVIVAIIFNLGIETYFSYVHGDIINQQECVKVGINVYHDMVQMSPIERFIFEYKTAFSWLIMAIGIGWILHGVGFKII
jgi:Sec-independent protein secretion pathway component TatC